MKPTPCEHDYDSTNQCHICGHEKPTPERKKAIEGLIEKVRDAWSPTSEEKCSMEPTKEDLESPMFNAVWNAIKKWDIQRVYGAGYAGATGTDVMTILNALKNAPSPEARCLCKSGIRGKHCFDYHPAEARVDWEREISDLVQAAISYAMKSDYGKFVSECKVILQAAFEKGREAR